MKRKCRVAWGLSGLLALVLVGGLSAFVRYGQQTRGFAIQWHSSSPWRYWWVGKCPIVTDDPVSRAGKQIGETYGVGFGLVDVFYRHSKRTIAQK